MKPISWCPKSVTFLTAMQTFVIANGIAPGCSPKRGFYLEAISFKTSVNTVCAFVVGCFRASKPSFLQFAQLDGMR